MKKIAKLSLVAAVAVAGLTSANAGSLENAIKNTDISGQFRYRMHNTESGATSKTETDVEIEVGVKSKITDNVTAVFKIDNALDNNDDGAAVNGNTTKGYGNKMRVEDYYFSYTGNGVTANLGQQNIPTRQLDGVQGDGLVLLTKAAGFTVGGAYFVNSGAAAGKDVTSVLATGKVGPATVLAQYSAVQDTLDAVNLRADAKFGPVKIGLEHAEHNPDTGSADNSTTKIELGTKVSNVSLGLIHVMNGDDDSGSIDGGAEAPSELTGFQVHSSNRKELSYTVVKVTVPVMAKTSFTLYHGTGDEYTTNNKTEDVSETFGQLTYKAAKNLTTYFRYGTSEIKGTDTDKARLEVLYTF